MEHPIEQFSQWWNTALEGSPLKQKSAVCVSTINEGGFPTGRFVDLKAADESGFTFCTFLDSNKGVDIRRNPKVALTIWWEHVGYQVRVTGVASQLAEEQAVAYWNTRSVDAQITTSCFEQSQPLTNEADLLDRFEQAREQWRGKPVPKPHYWGGYKVAPVAIEFLTFKENRLHFRELFEVAGNGWKKSLLQP